MIGSSKPTGRLAALLLLPPLLAPAAAGASDSVHDNGAGALRPVESREGRFRVELPASLPPPTRSSRWTLLGEVEEAHYDLDWKGARISVEHYDIPRLATVLFPSSLLLGQAADGVVEDMKGRELERRALERRRHPAQLVTYELPGSPAVLERVLIVLADTRLYVVVVTGVPGRALDPALESVIDSFEITP